jgi:hypothetical protein
VDACGEQADRQKYELAAKNSAPHAFTKAETSNICP